MHFVLGLVLLMHFLLASPQDHYDAWVERWSASVVSEGLTSALIQDRADSLLSIRRMTELVSLIEAAKTVEAEPVVTLQLDPTFRGWGGDVEQWRVLVGLYFEPGDVEWALAIIGCESGGNPNATHLNINGTTDYGLFQQNSAFWEARAQSAGFASDPFDPPSNVGVSAWLFYNQGPQHWSCNSQIENPR